MSRTIRRKNAHNKSGYVREVNEIDRWDLKRYNASNPKQCQDLMKAFFHSDNHAGSWGVPRWYRHFRNNRHKRHEQHELKRCQKFNEWEDHLPNVNVRDAGWYWW